MMSKGDLKVFSAMVSASGHVTTTSTNIRYTVHNVQVAQAIYKRMYIYQSQSGPKPTTSIDVITQCPDEYVYLKPLLEDCVKLLTKFYVVITE